MEDLHSFRKNYTKFQLNKIDVELDPLIQFKSWFSKAVKDASFEANAMVLSTVDAENKPSSRVLLLKEITTEGFVFFTNYESRKAKDLKKNNNASMLFFWEKFERQIRIEGTIEKIDPKLSEDYFNSRPRASQIGAVISQQSKVLESKELLDIEFSKYKNQEHIQKPKNWGGYTLKPKYFEFWQGRPSRLHDRITYTKVEDKWDIQMLYP